jgi:hypothetical protein
MHGRLVVNAGGFRNRCVVNVQVPQEIDGRERDSGGHVDDREEERVRLSIASYRITAQCSASQRIASVVGGLEGKITHRIVEGSWPQTECTGPNFGVRPLDYLDN